MAAWLGPKRSSGTIFKVHTRNFNGTWSTSPYWTYLGWLNEFTKVIKETYSSKYFDSMFSEENSFRKLLNANSSN